MDITYLEWNIGATGNVDYTIPSWAVEYLMTKNVDIIVLTEFRCGYNWDYFKQIIETKYDIYISPYSSSGINQVCIALRRAKGFNVKSIMVEDIYNSEIPELLQLNVSIDDIKQKEFVILGTRIKTQDNKKPNQIKFLNNRLKSLETCFCVGDFNITSGNLEKLLSPDLEVCGPRILNNYHSFVCEDNNKRGIDLVICKGLKKVTNPYPDQKDSPYATYDWGFLNKYHGYGTKSKNDFLAQNELPDHAILLGQFEI